MGGVYLHIPFCKSKCPYCDFYSFRGSSEEREAYTGALLDEIRTLRRTKKETGGIFRADTLYFGGGTPSLLSGEALVSLTSAAREAFHLPADAEITLECNPACDLEHLLPYIKEAGINRISLGMQSAVDTERKALGRSADRKRIEEVLSVLRSNGILNLSLDVMLGIPGQTEESLRETLDFIEYSSVPHVSAYLLTIEEGTYFGRHRDTLQLPGEDAVCALYHACCERLDSIGLRQYEISNFARPGSESRHNLKYWLGDDYLGLGAAAHSFVNGKRFFFPRDAARFLLGEAPVPDGEGGDEEEFILLRLRLRDGFSLGDFAARFGEAHRDSLVKKALLPKEQGLLVIENGRIFLTREGMLLSNSVIASLL